MIQQCAVNAVKKWNGSHRTSSLQHTVLTLDLSPILSMNSPLPPCLSAHPLRQTSSHVVSTHLISLRTVTLQKMCGCNTCNNFYLALAVCCRLWGLHSLGLLLGSEEALNTPPFDLCGGLGFIWWQVTTSTFSKLHMVRTLKPLIFDISGDCNLPGDVWTTSVSAVLFCSSGVFHMMYKTKSTQSPSLQYISSHCFPLYFHFSICPLMLHSAVKYGTLQ